MANDDDVDRSVSLDSCLDILGYIGANDIEVTIIGGVAVGAYASYVGVTSLSADLDVYASPQAQHDILKLAAANERRAGGKAAEATLVPNPGHGLARDRSRRVAPQ